MSKLRLCWIQMDVAWNNPEANFATVESSLAGEALRGALAETTTLLVLPEMFSTGFSMKVDRVADDGTYFERARHLARRYGIFLVAPMAFRGRNGLGRNMALLFSPAGDLVAAYQKIHPFSFVGEDRSYEKGREIVIFPIGGFHLSLFICYDLRFPEIFRHAAFQGANLILLPANWPGSRLGHFHALLRARAIENQAFVLGVNRLGRDPAVEYPGGTLLVDPRGSILAECADQAGFRFFDLESTILEEYRRDFPVLADIQPAFLGLEGDPGATRDSTRNFYF